MKAVIFGISGQDGVYLKALCQKGQAEVIGVSRSDDAELVVGDVADFSFVEALLREQRPDYVFHLAANSTTRHEALFENHKTISTGTLNILEAVKRHCPGSRVFITGSGVQFQNRGLPIAETDPFEASSPYAVARIQSVYAARYYRRLGIKAYVGYLFHHESPLRKESHVCKLIADAAKNIRDGGCKRIRMGDVSVRKEVGFAGDIVEGIWTLVNQDALFEATIGTGEAYSIEEWLAACFSRIGEDWRKHVDVSEEPFRIEYQTLVSNPATINQLGWRPKVGLHALAEMMLA